MIRKVDHEAPLQQRLAEIESEIRDQQSAHVAKISGLEAEKMAIHAKVQGLRNDELARRRAAILERLKPIDMKLGELMERRAELLAGRRFDAAERLTDEIQETMKRRRAVAAA